jgi:hypothetical protein
MPVAGSHSLGSDAQGHLASGGIVDAINHYVHIVLDFWPWQNEDVYAGVHEKQALAAPKRVEELEMTRAFTQGQFREVRFTIGWGMCRGVLLREQRDRI